MLNEIKGTITRYKTNPEGTNGILLLDGGFICETIELPWRDNIRGKSCVPSSEVLFKWRTDSPKHGACYEEYDDPSTTVREDVVGRDHIQIHAANLAGDVDQGYISQVEGCIAVGEEVRIFRAGIKPAGKKDQHGVTASAATLGRMNSHCQGRPLRLRIEWKEGVLG